MQLTESSIFVGLKRLRKILYQCQFRMGKANRIIYGTPLMEASGKAISCFVLAFTIKEKRVTYLEESIGWYSILRNDLDFCVEENIIHFPHKKVDKESKDATEEDLVNSQKVELFKLVAKIDDDMCRWRASLAKGKTIIA